MRKIVNYISKNFNEYHFIFLWTVMNILQIDTTELTSDEGYYWFYASKLEWGYYDHPPFLALLIKMGRMLFAGEIGVRFFNVLLMSTGLIFLFKIAPWNKREKKFIYLILLSIPLFNYITIIAFPDTPLVAISIICLYAYKRLIDKNDLLSSLLFGISIALMLYSKYHAVIFVFFILLSNLTLLRNKYFYLSIVLSGVLFIPHLLWQYKHDFPSFNYHLVGRASQFNFDYLFQFISQQIAIVGIGILFIPFVYKPNSQFEKTLKYIGIGTFIFFLLGTFRGFVHLHWTSIILFPIIILSVRYYSMKRNNRLFYCLVIPFLVMILLGRLFMAISVLPVNTLNVDYYHGRKLWAADIKAIAGNDPVIFEIGNSGTREASLYSFYSRSLGIAYYPGESKKSQYQIWNYEDSAQAKKVMLIKSNQFKGSEELHTRMGKSLHYKMIDNFNSYSNIKIDYNAGDIEYKDDSIKVPIQIVNHRQYPLRFDNNQSVFITLSKEDKGLIVERPINILVQAGDTAKFSFSFNVTNMDEGNYEFAFGIKDGIMEPSINSKRSSLVVKKSNR